MTAAKDLFAEKPMSPLQYATVLVCFVMNMLDGMDVLVISYAAPAISRDWAISPEALGVVFSAGLAGMTLGTFLLAPLADRFGRKTIILVSALIMGVCIYLSAYAGSVPELLLYRFLSGLGIGSMLASTTALTAEYTPDKNRDFWVSFVVAGYPIGAIVSGIAAAEIVPAEGWRQLFRLAGMASLAAFPIAFLLLSESVQYLLTTQPRGALHRANRILGRLGSPLLEDLPEKAARRARIPAGSLFKQEFRRATWLLWGALFLAFSALYFLISWIPKLASDAGLSMELAIYAGTVFNAGAFVGILVQGYISSRFGLRRTIGVIFLATSALMASFGWFAGTDWVLLILGLLGFGIQGGFVGLYAVAARIYPTHIRTTGVGWAMGAGRFGGIAGPLIGGWLIGLGLALSANFLLFAIPTLLAGLITWRIPVR